MAEANGAWGDPSPAGLFAVGSGTTAVWALLTGRVGLQDVPVLVVWLLAAGLVQILVGVIHLRNGDPVGGSLNLAFGALFFGAPALTNAVVLWGGRPMEHVGITAAPGFAINGWVFLLLGIVLAAFLPIVARQSWLTLLALAGFVVAIWMLAVFNLQAPEAQAAGAWPLVAALAGWIIGLAGLVMVYEGIALSLMYGLGRAVLPTGGPLGGGAPGAEPG